MDRRSFISRITVSSGGLALACSSLGKRAGAYAHAENSEDLRAPGYGEIFPTAAKKMAKVAK